MFDQLVSIPPSQRWFTTRWPFSFNDSATTAFYTLSLHDALPISRDVVVFALLEDMLAGRPVAYADFLGYDEAAHHAGLERADSLAVLRSIDQQVGRPHRAAPLAPRPYHLVLLSSHCHTQGWAFADR